MITESTALGDMTSLRKASAAVLAEESQDVDLYELRFPFLTFLSINAEST